MRRNKQIKASSQSEERYLKKDKSFQNGNASLPELTSKSKKKEFIVCGWNACQRLFEKRPKDILRLYFSKDRAIVLKPIVKFCANHKLPYRKIPPEELVKVSASVHHEGVVMITKPPKFKSTVELISEQLPTEGVWLALDRIGNSHNLGALARTASFFGIDGLIIGHAAEQAIATTSAFRTAEGAFEAVPLLICRDLASALRDLKTAGVFVVGNDTKAEASLFDAKLKLPCVLVMGSERDGLTARVKQRCDAVFRIPGEEQMQSLNVSVAAGIAMAEVYKKKNKIKREN